jgi:hypothetical protein
MLCNMQVVHCLLALVTHTPDTEVRESENKQQNKVIKFLSWNSVGCCLSVDVDEGGQIIRLTEQVS